MSVKYYIDWTLTPMESLTSADLEIRASIHISRCLDCLPYIDLTLVFCWLYKFPISGHFVTYVTVLPQVPQSC